MVETLNDKEELVAALNRCKASLASVDEMLDRAGGPQLDRTTQLVAKKKFILDSVAVNAAHYTVQSAKLAQKGEFVELTVIPYNQKLAHLTRLDSQVQALNKQLQSLKKNMSLPGLVLSARTLLQVSERFVSENTPKESLLLEEIYSLSPDLELPHVNYSEFKHLVDLEARKRLLLQIKYELLLRVKSQAQRDQRHWSQLNSRITAFVQGELGGMLREIGQVRRDESQKDLKFEGQEQDDTSRGGSRSGSPEEEAKAGHEAAVDEDSTMVY